MIVCFDASKVKGYDPNKKYLLNIRKDANPASEVVGTKEPGDEFEVEALDAERAMTALVEGGYAMTEYLTVVGDACQHAADELETFSLAHKEDGIADVEDDGSAVQGPVAETIEQKGPDTSKLEAMEREDLLTLAKESGIKVRANASKKTIIAALMADGD